MKKLILLLTVQLVAMTLCAQKPHNFSGENQTVFFEPGKIRTIKLGDPTDVDSKYYWHLVDGGSSATIKDEHKCQCSLEISESGSYLIQVERLSEYGYQTENVTIETVETFNVLSVERKKGRGCFSGSGTVSMQDFNFKTAENVSESMLHEYLRIKEGYKTVEAPTFGLLGAEEVRFEQLVKNDDGDEWVDIVPIGTVYCYSTNTIGFSFSKSKSLNEEKMNQCSKELSNKDFVADYVAKRFWIYLTRLRQLAAAGKDITAMADKIKGVPTQSPITVNFDITGGFDVTFSAECYNGDPGYKVQWNVNLGLTAGISAQLPTKWVIPKVGGLYFTASASLTAVFNYNLDLHFSNDRHSAGNDWQLSVPVTVEGKFGLALGTEDSNCLQFRADFVFKPALTFVINENVFNNNPASFDIYATCFVLYRSLKFGNYVFPVYHAPDN